MQLVIFSHAVLRSVFMQSRIREILAGGRIRRWQISSKRRSQRVKVDISGKVDFLLLFLVLISHVRSGAPSVHNCVPNRRLMFQWSSPKRL